MYAHARSKVNDRHHVSDYNSTEPWALTSSTHKVLHYQNVQEKFNGLSSRARAGPINVYKVQYVAFRVTRLSATSTIVVTPS